MNKEEFLAFLKENKGEFPGANFMLKLMRSFADQSAEDEEITFESFLQYLKQNILVLRKGMEFTDDETRNFLQLISLNSNFILEYDTSQQATSQCEYKQSGELTILHDAASDNNLKFLSDLVANGADINIRSRKGFQGTSTTPFMELAHSFKLFNLTVSQIEESIKTMLDLGADIHFKNEHSKTALDYAIEAKNKNCVAVLLKHGVEFNYERGYRVGNSSSRKAIKILLEQAYSFAPPTLIISKNQKAHDLIYQNIPVHGVTSIVVSYLFKNDLNTYAYIFQKDDNSPKIQLSFEEPEQPKEAPKSRCLIQ